MDYYYSEVRLLEYRIPFSTFAINPIVSISEENHFSQILMLRCLILFKSYDKLTQQCKNWNLIGLIP